MTTQYDVIIVGAGIAGMTAAIYASRAGKRVLVLEEKVHGGQIINTFSIENWPGAPGISGVDLVNNIYEQVVNLGVEVEYDEVVEIQQGDSFVVKTEDAEYTAGSVILAVGAEDKKLGLASEERLTGRGVSYCATCDGAFYKDKSVAIIGGGNTALYDALYLADIAKKVFLVHRRNEFRGDAVLVERLKKLENVEFVTPFVPVEIIGEDKVTCVKVEMMNAEEKRAGDKYRFLEVDGIFVAVGKKPMTERFADLVKLDGRGYVVAGEDCATSCSGVFVAGDCRTKSVRQLVTAAADGAVAAGQAVEYLAQK